MTADTVSTPDQVTSAPSDLRRLFGSHLIVVGFFTPDYAEAASAFSKNLIEHSVSHHLYARAKVDGGWRAQIFQKPATLAVARRDYPDAVVAFMDVDCSIRGDISGIVETRGDVALRIKGRAVGRGYAVKLSSRVIVVMPTSGGTAFIDAWISECRDHEMGTESALVPTIEHSAGRFSLAALPLRYAGMELRDAPANAVILHDSIHDPQRPGWAARKGVEKFFRMGRNAAYRLATGKGYDERRKR
jgi:hypothetical protein